MSISLIKIYHAYAIKNGVYRKKCKKAVAMRFFHCFLWIFSHFVTNNILDAIPKIRKQRPVLGANEGVNMKSTEIARRSTGVTRRCDELGRLVLPKEIRRTMRIREGDPLEIFTNREGEIILKKYSPIGELASFADEYAETLYKTCSLCVVISDRDAVIATAGVPRKEYLEKALSPSLEKIIENRALYIWREGMERLPVLADGGSHTVSCAMPILAEGDIVGCVISLTATDKQGRIGAPSEAESKLIQTAAGFLGRQLES